MSRIGKKVIKIPEKTIVSISDDVVYVKGPLGEISKPIHPFIKIEVSDGKVEVCPSRETKDSNKLWGTAVSHVQNMIAGVNIPYEKKLLIEGIGFKAEVKGQDVVMSLGLSHPVIVSVPRGVKVTSEKGVITVSGIDKEQVGSFAAALRSLKKPEPYKGKGIRYENEVIKRKQGKKTVAAA